MIISQTANNNVNDDDINSNQHTNLTDNANSDLHKIQQSISSQQNLRSQLKVMILRPSDSVLDQIVNQTLFEKRVREEKHELDSSKDVYLTETNTQCVLKLPTTHVFDSEESQPLKEQVLETNKKYRESLEQHTNSDLFSSAWTQTFTVHHKNRSIQAAPCDTKEQMTQSSKWQIHDSIHDSPESVAKKAIKTEPELSSSIEFKTMLRHMECAVVQNVMSREQILYRTHASHWKDNLLSCFQF